MTALQNAHSSNPQNERGFQPFGGQPSMISVSFCHFNGRLRGWYGSRALKKEVCPIKWAKKKKKKGRSTAARRFR